MENETIILKRNHFDVSFASAKKEFLEYNEKQAAMAPEEKEAWEREVRDILEECKAKRPQKKYVPDKEAAEKFKLVVPLVDELAEELCCNAEVTINNDYVGSIKLTSDIFLFSGDSQCRRQLTALLFFADCTDISADLEDPEVITIRFSFFFEKEVDE